MYGIKRTASSAGQIRSTPVFQAFAAARSQGNRALNRRCRNNNENKMVSVGLDQFAPGESIRKPHSQTKIIGDSAEPPLNKLTHRVQQCDDQPRDNKNYHNP
jgi:hypothetical protein